jgi:hypothetical protein
VRLGGHSSYTVVALAASRRNRLAVRLRGQVRIGRIMVFSAATAVLMIGAMRVPAFSPAGADLANTAQRLYADNLWAQVQLSLLLIGCFIPWLIYAMLWRGAARGAFTLGGVTLAGTALATWLTVATLGTYAALPGSVSGVVSRLEGRTIQLAGTPRTYYLALSDKQLESASGWLKRGAPVLMWVSPRGQVGALEPGDPTAGVD